MNKLGIWGIVIAGAFAVSMLAITALEAEAKPPSQAICPTENVQHWATFNWEGAITITHPTLPSIGAGVLEIQVPSDENYSATGVVTAKLTELGYLDSTSQPLTTRDISLAIPTGNSSTICAEN